MRLQPGNAKALYRRGLALLGCGEAALAKGDLVAAAKKEPRNQEIRRSLEESGLPEVGGRCAEVLEPCGGAEEGQERGGEVAFGEVLSSGIRRLPVALAVKRARLLRKGREVSCMGCSFQDKAIHVAKPG